MSKRTLLGVYIARRLVRGDAHAARVLFLTAPKPVSWTVAEARAIAGACRYAREQWGAPVSFDQFL